MDPQRMNNKKVHVNSKFFHMLISKGIRQNSILGIQHDGKWRTNPEDFKNCFLPIPWKDLKTIKELNILELVTDSNNWVHLRSHIMKLCLLLVRFEMLFGNVVVTLGPGGYTFAFNKKHWALF